VKRRKELTAVFLLSVFLFSAVTVHAKAIYEPENREESNIQNDNSTYDIIVDKNNEAHYESIQEAINQAMSGSTIYVKIGTYSEIININKKINLIGEDKDKTFINLVSEKNSYAVRITTNGVTLSGFGINNQGPGLYTTGIKISASQTTIDDCNIFDTPVGIAIWSSYNTISNCRFWGCADEGIAFLGSYLSECNNNVVKNCIFYENCDGIELQYSSNNQISNCEFYNNTHAGIDAIGSSNNDNIISNCEIYDNKVFGIYLSRSSGNQITQSLLSNNKLMASGSKDTKLTDCTLGAIYLIDESSLNIEDCENLDESNIKTVNSEYQINSIEETENSISETDSQREIRNRIINRIRSILSLWNVTRIRFRN